MKKIIITLFTVIVFKVSYSQYEINPSIINVAIRIEMKNRGSGSGFFLRDSNYFYFVTAAHVIYDDKGLFCDSTFIIGYREDTEIDIADTLFLSLCDANKRGYVVVDKSNDVAIVKLGIVERLDSNWNSIKYLPFAKRKKSAKKNEWNIVDIKKFKETNIGNDVFLFGYPKSLNLQFAFDFNRPLLRKGIIAGRDTKLIRTIIDCPSYQGNSGGPVFSVPFGYDKIYLIGIVTAFIPLEEHWYSDIYRIKNTQISNSGYSVVIPIDFVLNLLPKLK